MACALHKRIHAASKIPSNTKHFWSWWKPTIAYAPTAPETVKVLVDRKSTDARLPNCIKTKKGIVLTESRDLTEDKDLRRRKTTKPQNSCIL
jgi:hypothetical protein